MIFSGSKPTNVCSASRSGPVRLSRMNAWGWSSREAAKSEYGSIPGSRATRSMASASEHDLADRASERGGVGVLEEVPPGGDPARASTDRGSDGVEEIVRRRAAGAARDDHGHGGSADRVHQVAGVRGHRRLHDPRAELRDRPDAMGEPGPRSRLRHGGMRHAEDGKAEARRGVDDAARVGEHPLLRDVAEVDLDGHRVRPERERPLRKGSKDLRRWAGPEHGPRGEMDDEPRGRREGGGDPGDESRVRDDPGDRGAAERPEEGDGGLDPRKGPGRETVVEGEEEEAASGALATAEATGGSRR